MGVNSKLISITRRSDVKDEWLNYNKSHYENTSEEDIIHVELLHCETSAKSYDLVDCFKMNELSDFKNHLIQHNINWDNVKFFDYEYGTSLEEMLKAIIPNNGIVMFLPEY